MSALLVHPKPGSYVGEWAAVQIADADSYSSIKVLMKNSPWIAQMDISNDVRFVFTQSHAGSIEQWVLGVGSWVVKSPHGKFWFMDNSEFLSQFEIGDFQ